METRLIIILVTILLLLFYFLGDCKKCKASYKEGFSGCKCGKCYWDKNGNNGCVGCVKQPVSTVAPPPLPKVCGPHNCNCGNIEKCGMCAENKKYRIYKKPNYYGFGPWNWKYHYGEPYYIKFVNT